MHIVDFFKGIGRALAAAFGVIKKLIPEAQLLAGLELAEAAALKFTDNAQRRAWVIAELMKRFPIGESIARLIVELAVAQLKHGISAGVDKIEDALPNPT